MRDKIIYEKIKQLTIILDDIDNMIETHPNELQQIDLELSDWLHYVENNELDEKQSYKIMKEIQRLRKERRYLHNEYEIEKTYKDNYSKLTGNNSRPFLLAEINKTIKQLNSNYKNRVLTEDKIKEVIETKKRGRPRQDDNNE